MRFAVGDYIFVPQIRERLLAGASEITALWLHDGWAETLTLSLDELTPKERRIIAEGCLINYYRNGN